jgi:TonB family protein
MHELTFFRIRTLKIPVVRAFSLLSLIACSAFSAPQEETRVYPHEPLPDSWQATWPASSRVFFDTPPKLIRSGGPIYPIRQWQLGNSGEAVVEFTIGEDGKARNFRIVSTNDKSFANHAILAIEQWQWATARKRGHPVPVRVRVPFKFVAR